MSKKKKNKFTLKNVLEDFTKELVNDCARNLVKDSPYKESAEDVYYKVIPRLQVFVRWFDSDFNNLPF